MCGIAGYLGPRALADERLQACLRLMRRRGPDHAALRSWTNTGRGAVHLLHTRLKIIDLDDRANQPCQTGSKWMAYNGELYNYLERRAELTARGETFTTASDTEVLLRTIEVDGWGGLDRCEGMWAFALYDEADGSLTLCRDRFGEKPLYLYRDASGVYFGSEVKFIACLLGRPLTANRDQLYRYLVNGYRALYKDGQTFFQDVEEVPPGTRVRLEALGDPQRTAYWQPRIGPQEEMSYDEAVAGVRQRLIRAVELRLRADVPLAFCLSGGIDSNSLIAIAKRVFGYDVHGFTILNEDDRYEEHDEVEHVVSELGIRHTWVPIPQQEFLGSLRELIRQHDAPVYTISYYLHWLLMGQIAARGYRVAVSGTAADEMLAGYYDHQTFYLCEVRQTPLWASAWSAWRQHVEPHVRNPLLQDPGRFLEDPTRRDHLYLDHEEFAQYLTREWREAFHEVRYTDSLLRNRMLNEMFHESVPVMLHEDDLNAMFFSIENRSPFLDRELFEFCCRIPTAYLIREGLGKAVLRDAMSGLVPDLILKNTRKVGFNAPVHSLMDVRDGASRRWLLADGPLFDHLRRDKVAALLDVPYLENSQSKFLFNILCAKIFLEEQA